VVRLLADFQVSCGTELKSIIKEAIGTTNFIKSDAFLTLIEDSLRMRLNHLVKNGESTE